MVKFIKSLYGDTARSCNLIDGSLWMKSCFIKKCNSTEHCLKSNLLRILWVESHFNTTLHHCTNESHDISNSASRHHHSRRDKTLFTHHGLANEREERVHEFSILFCYPWRRSYECHALPIFSCNVRHAIERAYIFTCKCLFNVFVEDICSNRNNELVFEINTPRDFFCHLREYPWFHRHNNYVSSENSLSIICCSHNPFTLSSDAIDCFLRMSSDSDGVFPLHILKGFRPSLDECASHIS